MARKKPSFRIAFIFISRPARPNFHQEGFSGYQRASGFVILLAVGVQLSQSSLVVCLGLLQAPLRLLATMLCDGGASGFPRRSSSVFSKRPKCPLAVISARSACCRASAKVARASDSCRAVSARSAEALSHSWRRVATSTVSTFFSAVTVSRAS